MANRCLIIGSRSSKLALIQAGIVRDNLRVKYPCLSIEIKTIKTTGDKILDVPLSKVGGKGIFIKEIEEALLKKEIDVAVHSMKDVPTKIPEGLKIGAITEREDPCDILVSRKGFTLDTLPEGSKIGTSSLRRRAQILNRRPDLRVEDLRGNLDTRIRKLGEGMFDAIILASAGVNRLGIRLNMSRISIDDILPQAGQAALGIEIRQDDSEVGEIVNLLDAPDSHLSIETERTLLSCLGGGCQVPIGVYARIDDSKIFVKAGVFSVDGKTAIREEIVGERKDADTLSRKLADRLLRKGARQILEE